MAREPIPSRPVLGAGSQRRRRAPAGWSLSWPGRAIPWAGMRPPGVEDRGDLHIGVLGQQGIDLGHHLGGERSAEGGSRMH